MQVVSTICLYLTNNMVIHMLSKTSLMTMWIKFEEIYMMKSLTNSLSLEAVLPTMDEQGIEHVEVSQQLPKKSSLISSVLMRRLRRRPEH